MTDPGEQEATAPVDRAGLQDGAVRGAAWTVIHTLISLPLAFVVNLVVARTLGISDYGRLAFLSSVMDVAGGIITLGFGTALIQFGSRYHASGRGDELRHLLSAAQGFRLLVAAPLLSLVVFLVADVDPQMLVLAIVFGILVPSAFDGASACLWIENKSAAGAKIALISSLASSAAVLAVVFTIGTPDAVWATRLVVGGASVALGLIPISPSYRRAVLQPRLPRGLPPGFWRFTIPTAIAGVIGGLVVSRSEIFFMTWLATPAAVGAFALAYGLASHIFAPAQAFIGPLVPAISSLREIDAGSLASAFRRTLRAGSTFVGVITAGAVAALALLVPVLYGHQYVSAAPLVVALGISSGLLVVATPVTAFVTSRLSAGELLRANIIALVVDVVLAVTLIPFIDVWGAVIANVGSAATRLLILMRREIELLDLTWRDVAGQSLPAVLGALVCIASWFIARTLGFGLLPAVVAALVGALGMLVLLRLTRSGLTPGDSASITRTFGARIQRFGRPLLSLVTQRREEG